MQFKLGMENILKTKFNTPHHLHELSYQNQDCMQTSNYEFSPSRTLLRLSKAAFYVNNFKQHAFVSQIMNEVFTIVVHFILCSLC